MFDSLNLKPFVASVILTLYGVHVMCDKIFCTEELRERVFSYANKKCLSRLARVRKDWTDACLDILWAEVDKNPSVYNLVEILSPMDYVPVVGSNEITLAFIIISLSIIFP